MRWVRPLHPSHEVVPLARFGLFDLESVRLVLRGSSVVDWVCLHFHDDHEISAFIRVNELDPDQPDDQIRLAELKLRAIDFLEDLRYRVPDTIKSAEPFDLFRYASRKKGRRSHRLYACMTLKVMHIMHHADGYELLSRVPFSYAELNVLIQAKIERVVRGLLERDFPVVRFSGNRKTKSSTLSKLLAKRDTQSAKVFDKLRFRLIVERREDIPSLLLALTRELVPFNYLVPGQTHNSLVDLDHMLVRAGNPVAIRSEAAKEHDLNEARIVELTDWRKNEFSGPDYRIVNFVADIPLRVDTIFPHLDAEFRLLGPVVFGLVEFQIADRETDRTNEQGENRHALYKARQRSKIKQRLEAGKRRAKPKSAEVGVGARPLILSALPKREEDEK